MIKEAMEADGKDYKTARSKVRISTSRAFSTPTLILDQVLARDGFRCVLTGTFNKATLMENSELARTARTSPNFLINTVVTCHILNVSTMQGVDPSGDGKGGSVANKVWAICHPVPSYNLHILSGRVMPSTVLDFSIALDSGTSSKHSFREMVFTILEI